MSKKLQKAIRKNYFIKQLKYWLKEIEEGKINSIRYIGYNGETFFNKRKIERVLSKIQS